MLLPAYCFFRQQSDSRFGQSPHQYNRIRAGDHNLENDSDNQFVKTYKITNVVKHPGYLGRGPQNDLAIAFTKTKIDYNARIGKISIPETKIDVTFPTEALLSAWMYKDDHDRYIDSVFKTGYIQMFSEDYCVSKFPNRGV